LAQVAQLVYQEALEAIHSFQQLHHLVAVVVVEKHLILQPLAVQVVAVVVMK
jgi:hypothetical protein